MTPNPRLQRWRLLLGQPSAEALASAGGMGPEDSARDAALSWLYDRDAALEERDIRRAGQDPARLSVPAWLQSIHRLFPKKPSSAWSATRWSSTACWRW